MHKIKSFVLILISASFLFSLSTCSSTMNSDTDQDEEEMMDNEGMDGFKTDGNAPDFTYTSLGGNEYTLSEMGGNVVYIFFFGSECPHCRNNGPVTEDQIYQEFKGPDFIALGLDTWNTSASQVESFKEVTGITYPLLLNAKQSLIDYYGDESSYDRSVVIDGQGDIAYKGTGFVDSDVDTVMSVIEAELDNLEE